jgi:uncharacterized membrane protein YgcG
MVRRLLVLLGALLLVVLGAGPAVAAPVQATARLTDDAGALDAADRAEVGGVLDGLAERTGIGLNVVFLPTFESTSADAWAARTAEQSGLDSSDLLVAVAIDETDGSYEYGWWMSDQSPLDEDTVASILTDHVEPYLDSGDWAGAVRTAGDDLESAARNQAAAAAEEKRTEWTPTTVVVIIGAVVVALLAAHLLSRRRRAVRSLAG